MMITKRIKIKRNWYQIQLINPLMYYVSYDINGEYQEGHVPHTHIKQVEQDLRQHLIK